MNADASSKKREKKGKEQNLQEQIKKSISAIISNLILANIKLIGISALVIVVVAVAIFGWMTYKKSLNEKALVLENEARELHNTVNSEATSDESETTAKSLQDVLALYQQIIEEYPGTVSAERAWYFSGSLEYNMGNYDKAYEYFETYIKKYPKGQLRFRAEEDIGYIFEQQGEYQKAIEQFKSIEDKVPSSTKSELLLAIGRNYESLGQTDNAVEIYQNIIDSNTSVSSKNKARERLDILRPGAFLLEESEEESPKEPEKASLEEGSQTTEGEQEESKQEESKEEQSSP
jgi:tetratricopeptide (TPR) repeat protein